MEYGIWIESLGGHLETHTHFEEWVQSHNQAVDEWCRFKDCKASWNGGKSNIHPATIEIKQGAQEWHMLAYPSQDIFSVNPDVGMHMCAKFGDSCLSMSFIRNHDEGCRQLIPLDNIAFEFDQSWMAEAGMFYYDIKREQSARRYWASLIRGVLEGRVTPSESLWIIDRNSKWFEESLRDNKTVYRDCEGEYVEMGWDNVPKSTGDGVSLSASAFLSSFISSSHVELRQIFAGSGSLYTDCA
ncbi:hypothetical protein FLAG1_10957 [Fusarium langsethiae]|uniref:Uncharacterized protein n=1 Tax=Fusarium langsethiae TaxID=179993 RepID=A0A0N1J296_FUSLA|nr:hypothetical protein FLAG1_10957 [Fusarium langsethiae]GKU08133.1 unnamed protein product [Fusarium langsethiae]GKU22729.1 unnamed protein product [Fusarium langsethiae]